ncbi:hypothetical protein AO1008_02385 [Aspergillus oryzae 100-8]|uniref:Zn(2)-C6 fungal-type domain-containing protein n=1 Tax=Aspergillus oryzae (strain 3.042) TaxID=1160506 RepID=I8TPG5_ASPO3|nr:hypothetical protein Ao3042_08057 [Aspergillus oryzae 3.042]KDE76270.1 hypothetical protein AO1008_02385 [Aspergillus oryzae 100-8]|eukprot:EIT75863.1 hypothetical protein Ao3042_08057 [Aspergillus oryzae 3.042]
MRRVHAVDGPVSQTKRACLNCRSLKSRCEGGPLCHDCIRRKIPCFPISSPSAGSWKKQCFVDLYFEKFHPYWPFIHRGSFNGFNETPLLAQSVMVIGLWLSGERSAQSAALDLHKTLGLAIRQQKEVWDASGVEGACSDCSWPILTYQAILLHIIFALLQRGAELLHSLVGSCQRLGMFYYPNMLARYQSDDLASYVWVSIEEVKRFDLALYKFHKMLRRAGTRDSAVVDGALTAADLRFPMPTNDALWHAVCKDQWLSATTKGVYLCNLNDAMEDQWISNSAELIGFLF